MTTSDEIHKKINEIEESDGISSIQKQQVQATLLIAEVLNEINWNLTYIKKGIDGIRQQQQYR